MKPSGKSYTANPRLHHEGTQCGGTVKRYASFSSDTAWRWPKTTPETRRRVFCSWHAPSVGYNLVVCLSLTWNMHNMKRLTDHICKGEKRLRHYMCHCEPSNHTNINVVLNWIRKKSRTGFAQSSYWCHGLQACDIAYLPTYLLHGAQTILRS